MKNKIIMLACVLVASFLLGVTGAVTFAKDEPTDNADSLSKDRLIGFFITSDSVPDQGKLYAKLVDDPYTNPETGETVTTKKFVFDGVEGIAFFSARYTDEESGVQYRGTCGDDAISDAHTDYNGDSIEMKGTIYLSTTKDSTVFYYNPVYQTAAGEVYLMLGEGMSYGSVSGSHTLKELLTVTRDGESETIGSSIEVSTCIMDMPVGTRVLQFDKDGNRISAEDYGAGDLPLEITTSSDAEYIIVETHMKSADGKETVTRELFQPNDETLFAFFCREDGICIKQYCSIVWN